MPRTTNRIVDDLKKLPQRAGEKPPYLLVGHSFGGFTIRVFAARHPADVAGLIFVDSSHPEQTRRMPDNVKRKQAAFNRVSQEIPWLSRIGVVRAAYVWMGSPGENTYLESQPKYTGAFISELNSLEESSAQTRAAASSFEDLPLTVLRAGTEGAGDPAMYALWRSQLQPELAHLSTCGQQVIVEGSTRIIPAQRRRAVVEAVRELLAT
jgi:pimeloyl-ACP methyl ester carboxylesterase